MPQPLPVGKACRYGPDAILERRELAALAANVCANWALVESDMMWLYALLMGRYLPRYEVPGFESAVPTHPVAYQVFDALNGFQPRLDLLTRLCKWIASKEEFDRFTHLIETHRIKRRFTERSVIAHGVWGVCDDYADALILVRTYGGNQIWKEKDFAQVSGRILALHRDLGAFMAMLFERFRGGR